MTFLRAPLSMALLLVGLIATIPHWSGFVNAQTVTPAATPLAQPAPTVAKSACPSGYWHYDGHCLLGGKRYTSQVGLLPPGPDALVKLEDSAIVFENVYQYGSNSVRADGAYGPNTTAPRSAWYLEYQRAGGLDVIAGVERDEPDLIGEGLSMFRFGLQRQAANGSFPGSAWPFHGTAMFLSEAGPALIVLERSRYMARFMDEVTWQVARMRKASYYMVRYVHGPQHIDDTTKNHRLYEAAIALGAVGVLANDATLQNWSQMYAWRGVHMERPGGVMPENRGHDSGYQALGMVTAIRYLVLLASGSLRTALFAALQKGEAWELSRIRPDGSVNQAGDTRTAGCKEHAPTGECKTVFTVPIVAALSRWAAVTGDGRFAQAARLVHNRVA